MNWKQGVLDFLEIFTGLRKTLVYIMLIAVGICFRMKGLASGESVMEMLKTVGCAYMGAAGIDHIGEILTAHLDSKADK